MKELFLGGFRVNLIISASNHIHLAVLVSTKPILHFTATRIMDNLRLCLSSDVQRKPFPISDHNHIDINNLVDRNLDMNLTIFCYIVVLVQIENYIKESMKTEMAQLQQSAVHNHTAAMLEMGTNLLSQTAEQTRKLTDVETQVTPC